jgi:hypothetical protein
MRKRDNRIARQRMGRRCQHTLLDMKIVMVIPDKNASANGKVF